MKSIYALLYGWIGTKWQKIPLLFGYSARIGDNIDATTPGGGSTNADSGAVPAGEIWVITIITAFHDDPANRDTYIQGVLATGTPALAHDPALAQGETLATYSPLIMAEGDILRARCISLADTKNITLNYAGYRMDIDQ